MRELKDIPPGTKIGRLTVIRPGEPEIINGKKYSTSICECSCSDHTVKTIKNCLLRRKNRPVLSCGCAQKIRVNPATPKHLPRTMKGYRYVYAPDAIGANASLSYKGYILEHRLVMERFLGRGLSDDEAVHHKDFNRMNNDIKNLILLTNEEHARLHGLVRGGIISRDDVITDEQIKAVLSNDKFRVCKDCGRELSVKELSSSSSLRCKKCAQVNSRKIERPSCEQLMKDVSEHSYLFLEKKYGASTNAIKKWIKSYGQVPPNRHECWIRDAKYVMTEKMIASHKIIGEKISQYFKTHDSPCNKAVVQYDKSMNKIGEYKSIADACRSNTGFNDSPLSRACRKSTTYRGFFWKYK